MELLGYRKLVAYQKAKEIVKITYKYIKLFPADERHALSEQLKRAAVSVTSNIAEGTSRFSIKDKSRFIEMAYGSLMELSSQFEIAEELRYITSNDRLSIDEKIIEESRLLSGLIKSYKQKNT